MSCHMDLNLKGAQAVNENYKLAIGQTLVQLRLKILFSIPNDESVKLICGIFSMSVTSEKKNPLITFSFNNF